MRWLLGLMIALCLLAGCTMSTTEPLDHLEELEPDELENGAPDSYRTHGGVI